MIKDRSRSKVTIIILVSLAIVLTLNILWLLSPWIGVPATLGYLLFSSWLIGKSIFQEKSGRYIIALVAVLGIMILWNYFFVLFFHYQPIQVVVSIWLVTLFSCWRVERVVADRIYIPEKNHKLHTLPRQVGALLLCISATASVLYIWDIYGLRQLALYHGSIPVDHRVSVTWLFVAIVGFGLSILSSIRTKYILFAGIVVLLALTSTNVVGFASLYGADSWRHFSVEKYISTGQTYNPTSISQLLTFQSEKIPNGTQYVTIPLLQSLTALDIQLVHKYFSWLILGPLSLLVIYFSARDFRARKLTAALATIFALTIPGFNYIGAGTFPQAFGLFFFLINAWIWLTTASFKGWKCKVVVTAISILACVTYPVTALFSIALIAGILISRLNPRLYTKWLQIISGLLAIGLLTAAFPILDIYLKKVPLNDLLVNSTNSVFGQYYSRLIDLVRQYSSNINSFIFIGFVIGIVKIFKTKETRKIGWLAGIFVCALQLTAWFNGFVAVKQLSVFSGRVYLLLSLISGVLFVTGIVFLLKRFSIVVAVSLIVIYSVVVAVQANPNSVDFGYSITKKEIIAVNTITASATTGYYAVLSDEVTAAAGNALTGYTAGHYYWYPGNVIGDAYWSVIQSPTISALKSSCANLRVDELYFINSPIPPNVSYKENIQILEGLMTPLPSSDRNIFRYLCSS